jgi:hypothetical protein
VQASGLEFEQILKDKLAQLGCDIYDGAFFDEVYFATLYDLLAHAFCFNFLYSFPLPLQPTHSPL